MDQGGQATLDRTSLERVYAFFGEMRDQGLLDAEGALGLADAAACWSLYQTGIGQLTSVPVGQFWQETREGSLPSWVPTEEGDPITILHTWGLAVVTQDPARQEVSLGLIRWLVTAQHMAELTRAAQLVPTRVQAIDAWALSPDESAFLKTLLSSSESALPPTVDSTVRRALQAGLTALLQRDVSSPESAASFALTYLRR
jgi:ABC-type glycerol-3-phosphate transport system substrate-binding protein